MTLSFSEQITNDSHKQHLNLTEFAWNIIENDMVDFLSGSRSRISLAAFLNKIIANCHKYPEAEIFPVNLSETINRQRHQYEKLLSRNKSLIDQDTLERLCDILMEQFKDELRPDKKKYPKGIGRKFRLNNEVYSLLCCIPRDSFETEFFQTPGKYLKCLFEEYAQLPYFKRERIFFCACINEIENAIKNLCLLRLSTGGNLYDVIPYNIETDSRSTFSYLIGASRQYPAPAKQPYILASFRISRIQDVRCIYSHTITSEQKKELKSAVEKSVSEKGVPFLMDDIQQISIRFTKEGIRKYSSQAHLRPAYSQRINEYEYQFLSTPYQIKAYFFKFGKDAEILSPPDLRAEFMEEYKSALNNYQDY